MKQKFDWVICFAPGDYHQFTPSCTTHIMHEMLRRGMRVLWINPPPVGVPGLFGRGNWNRITRRLRSVMKPMRSGRSGLISFSPIAPPNTIIGSSSTDQLAAWQIKKISKLLGIRRPLIWIENASTSYAAELFDGPRIFQMSDKYELSRYASELTRARIAVNSRNYVRNCDLVICTSRTLSNEVADVREDVMYLPHAVPQEFLNVDVVECPFDLERIHRPRLGYFGTLTSSNNQSLIEACARTHPEWNIVLIGRITGGDWSTLQSLPNVHFLGFKSPDLIPQYGCHFDVGLMTWNLDEWMHYVHPLKLREYLALGLPVVSVPIPEVVSEYSHLVHIADSPARFVAAVETALEQRSQMQCADRRAAVRDFTWAEYVDRVFHRLNSSFEENFVPQDESGVRAGRTPVLHSSAGRDQ